MSTTIAHLSGASKKTLPILFYCVTDYYFGRNYLKQNFFLPIPAIYSALSSLFIVGLILATSFICFKKCVIPKFNFNVLISAISLSFVFRYNIFDLNHNFGDPPYKRITSILLPLILIVNGGNTTSCVGMFLAILLSSSALNQTLVIQEAILAGILSPFMHAGFYFLARHRSENKDDTDYLSFEAQTKCFIEIAISVFAGTLICDTAVLMCQGLVSDIDNNLGTAGVCLYALSIWGKFMLIYFSMDFCDYAIMINWILKTIMFSFTYTLGYKFDLAISNLLAILFWIVYVVGSLIVMYVKEKKVKVKYNILTHND